MGMDARQQISMAEKAKNDRHNHESNWQEVADLVMPSRSFTTEHEPGAERNLEIYDDTAMLGAELLSATMHAMFTNPMLRWMGILSNDEGWNQDHDARLWLENATTRCLDLFASPASGFQTAAHENYLDHGGFGTANMFIRDDLDGQIRFQAVPLSNTYWIQDHRGEITDVFRSLEMRAIDVANTFPKASADTMKKAKDKARSDDMVKVWHRMFRRDDRDPRRMDGPNRPWGSVYLEHEAQKEIFVGGMHHKPYVCSRWSKTAGETYGRGPSQNALPTIRVLNIMVRTLMASAEKASDPPWLVESGSTEGPIPTAPASIIYYKTGMNPPQQSDNRSRINHGIELLQMKQRSVENAYYTNVLLIPELDRMTATEVLQRLNQKLQIMSPILSRLYEEFLTPIITTTLSLMLRKGMLPPAPPEFLAAGFKIDYLSPLALSQRASESQNFLQLMTTATPLIQAKPEVMDNINADESFRWLHGLFNVSQRVLERRENMAQMRQQREAQQNAAVQAQVAQATAGAAKDGASAIRELSLAG